MTLTAGTKLGPYEILASPGAGGVGEVCRLRLHPQRDPLRSNPKFPAPLKKYEVKP